MKLPQHAYLLVIILFTHFTLHAQVEFVDVDCGTVFHGTTIDSTSDFNFQNFSVCAPDKGYDSGDQAYRWIRPDGKNAATITLDILDPSADLDLLVFFDPSGMQNPPTICLRTSSVLTVGNEEIVEIPAGTSAGTYWLIVDGSSLGEVQESDYILTIDCGKTYDTLPCNEVITGTTKNRINKYDNYNDCFTELIKVYTAGDRLYRFDVAEQAQYDISLSILDNVDLDLFVLSSAEIDGQMCPDSCLLKSDETVGSTEEISGLFAPGTYWVVVDGNETPAFPDNIVEEGDFTISLNCGKIFSTIACGEKVIDSTTNNVNSYNNEDYADCLPAEFTSDYLAGDHLIRLDLDQADLVTIMLENLGSANLDLFLMENEIVNDMDCPGTCIEMSSDMGDDMIQASLDSGTYWLIVDALSDEGAFEITVTCETKTFQDISCGDAIVNDLINKVNNYDSTDYQGCMFDTFLYDFGDDLYRLVLEENTDITITMSGATDLSLGLFASETNSETQELCPGSCLDFSDIIGVQTEVITASLPPGTYWIIVDYFSTEVTDNLESFQYGLSVSCSIDNFLPISCNSTVIDSTIGRESSYIFSDYNTGGCFMGGNLFNQSDRAMLLELTEATSIELLFSQQDTSNLLSIFVLLNDSTSGNDEPGMCLATRTGPGTLDLDLQPGKYWMIVDGAEDVFELTLACSPLPITLASFDGERIHSRNQLTWVTLSEFESEGFEIQRSSNTVDWNTISFVPSKGNINQMTSYVFDDISPNLGPNYYRLKMVDLDGSFEFSEVVRIQVPTEQIRIFPNPVNQDFITVFPGGNQIEHVDIVDLTGRTVVAGSPIPSETGSISIRDVQPGLYLVLVKLNDGSTQQMKLIRQ